MLSPSGSSQFHLGYVYEFRLLSAFWWFSNDGFEIFSTYRDKRLPFHRALIELFNQARNVYFHCGMINCNVAVWPTKLYPRNAHSFLQNLQPRNNLWISPFPLQPISRCHISPLHEWSCPVSPNFKVEVYSGSELIKELGFSFEEWQWQLHLAD